MATTFRSNGLPSVTAILQAVGLGPDLTRVPPDILEATRDRGTQVHAGIEALHYGYDYEIDPEYKPWLDAYLRFVEETQHVPIISEGYVRNDAWGYEGHPDRIGWLTLKGFVGHRTVIDFKSGAAEGVDLQLAGYAAAYNAMNPKAQIDRAGAVALRKDGTYRFIPVDLRAATPIWYAAVTVYRERVRRHG